MWSSVEPDRGVRVGAYVLCERDDSLLLVRFRGEDAWTVPGGGIDHGERPEDAAVREVAEETGLEVTLGRLLVVDSTMWYPRIDGRVREVHALQILYAGEAVGGRLRDEPDGSTDRAAWVPVTQALELPASSILRTALALRDQVRS